MAKDEGKVPITAADQDVMKELHDLSGQIKEIQTRQNASGLSGEDRERLEKLTNAVNDLNRNFSERLSSRKSEFPATDPREIHMQYGNRGGSALLDELHRRRSDDPAIREFQQKADDLYITAAIINGNRDRPPVDPRSLRQYRDLLESPVMKTNEAVDVANVGSAGDGWYPVAFSAQLHEQVRLARRVAALHERVPMPTSPYKMPIEGSDAQVYVVAEKTGAEDYVTAANMITAAQTNITGEVATNLTLTAAKIGARMVVSADADEASIIPMLPYLRGKLVRAMADAEEDTTINGDTDTGTGSATDVDAQSYATTHHWASWNGYREHAISSAKIALATNTTLQIGDLRQVRLAMGKFGINPADLVYITGPGGYNKMLGMGQKIGSTQFASPVMTLDKYGPSATILSGELGKVDGIPIIVSEFVRENLGSSGYHDGGATNDKTLILCVNRAQFLYGDFRSMQLNSRYVPDTDQNVMVVLRKMTFNCWFTASPVVGISYDIDLGLQSA